MVSAGDDTPPYALLGAGVTGEDLHSAVSRSGYPFQAVVADRLRSKLSEKAHHPSIQEEWSYIDADTGQARSIDILARIPLGDRDDRHGRYPRLNLVVECKQSELPYVFFLREDPPQNLRLMRMSCSKNSLMSLMHVDEKEGQAVPYSMPLHDVFSVFDYPFFDADMPWAISISKMMRKPKLELSGEESYRAITLPLLKAVDYLESIAQGGSYKRSGFEINCCLAVIRAPLIGVTVHEEVPHLLSFPWFRVTHLEPVGDEGEAFSTDVRYFDVVHESFLNEYLSILMDSMNPLAERMVDHFDEIVSGKGLCTGRGEDVWPSLRPMPDDLSESMKDPNYMIHRALQGISITPPAEKPSIGDIAWFRYSSDSESPWVSE